MLISTDALLQQVRAVASPELRAWMTVYQDVARRGVEQAVGDHGLEQGKPREGDFLLSEKEKGTYWVHRVVGKTTQAVAFTMSGKPFGRVLILHNGEADRVGETHSRVMDATKMTWAAMVGGDRTRPDGHKLVVEGLLGLTVPVPAGARVWHYRDGGLGWQVLPVDLGGPTWRDVLRWRLPELTGGGASAVSAAVKALTAPVPEGLEAELLALSTVSDLARTTDNELHDLISQDPIHFHEHTDRELWGSRGGGGEKLAYLRAGWALFLTQQIEKLATEIRAMVEKRPRERDSGLSRSAAMTARTLAERYVPESMVYTALSKALPMAFPGLDQSAHWPSSMDVDDLDGTMRWLIEQYGKLPEPMVYPDEDRRPADAESAYFVSARNRAGRFVALLGPYETHREALENVLRGKRLVEERYSSDVDVMFGDVAFGTMRAPRSTTIMFPPAMERPAGQEGGETAEKPGKKQKDSAPNLLAIRALYDPNDEDLDERGRGSSKAAWLKAALSAAKYMAKELGIKLVSQADAIKARKKKEKVSYASVNEGGIGVSGEVWLHLVRGNREATVEFNAGVSSNLGVLYRLESGGVMSGMHPYHNRWHPWEEPWEDLVENVRAMFDEPEWGTIARLVIPKGADNLREPARMAPGHLDLPEVRAVQGLAARALAGEGVELGRGNFGRVVVLDGRVVKLPMEKNIHGEPWEPEEIRQWFLHEAGTVDALLPVMGRLLPETVYVEVDGVPALVREHGLPAGGISPEDVMAVEQGLEALGAAGWDVHDHLLVLRRLDGSVFLADTGFWFQRKEPMDHFGPIWWDEFERWAHESGYPVGPYARLEKRIKQAREWVDQAMTRGWEAGHVVDLRIDLEKLMEVARQRAALGLPAPPEN